MSTTNSWIDAVLHFWFEELQPADWFVKDVQIDARIRDRFHWLYEHLRLELPAAARASPGGCLASVIVLDQLPRNMFRNSPQAFASDAQALSIAQYAVSALLDQQLTVDGRAFLYMPYMHSEDPAMQSRSIELFASLADANRLEFARRHKAIIDRFGRFPHRNAPLARESSAEEVEFMKQNPGF